MSTGQDSERRLAIPSLGSLVRATLSHLSSIDTILVIWFVAAPVASFYLRYPSERSILTFDRAVFVLGVLALWLKSRRRVDFKASKFEICWALLSVAAVASVIKSNHIGYSLKLAVDSFGLPLVAFHLARHHLDVRARAKQLVLSAVVLAMLLFLTGGFEYITGTNLFQFKGSDLKREGELRVNGPFASDSSFAIICLLVTLFLWSAPRIFRIRMDASARLAYRLGIAAAVFATLLPLFRAVALALAGCLIIVRVLSRRALDRAKDGRRIWPRRRRVIVYSALILAPLLILFALIGTTGFGDRLASPHNLYGRLATWVVAAKITSEQPVFGVGLGNYTDYFHERDSRTDAPAESVQNSRAVDSPHSNWLWIAAEMGLVGFALYLAANVYIFLMGYRAYRQAETTEQRAASACYLALAAAYWVPGLTLTSAYYSDLNLYFFFLLGLLLNVCARHTSGFRGMTPAKG